jgi:ParB family chromosome partitioning protein
MERRLGRGLGSLLGQAGQAGQAEAQHAPNQLPIDQLRPNPYQPRSVFDPEALSELGDSIRAHGILQPIVVRAAVEGYEIISGERRWRAARQIGLLTVPVVVRDRVPDDQMLELALIENVQRQDLDAIERARGYRQMIAELEITQEEVAQKVGLKRATVANHLRLLELPASIQEAVGRGLISMGHARAMLGHPDPKRLLPLVERVTREGLSVRQVEQLIRAAGSSKSTPRTQGPESPKPAWVGELESRLRESLGRKVTLRNGAQYRGQVVIDYYDRDDLERLCNLLAPQAQL